MLYLFQVRELFVLNIDLDIELALATRILPIFMLDSIQHMKQHAIYILHIEVVTCLYSKGKSLYSQQYLA